MKIIQMVGGSDKKFAKLGRGIMRGFISTDLQSADEGSNIANDAMLLPEDFHSQAPAHRVPIQDEQIDLLSGQDKS